ncbi:MAG: Transposase [Nitrospira sp.]|nr:Transposase [Nitrospira sp.]
MRYAFIRTQEQTYRVTRLCRALAVSRSGYYAWRSRAISARAAADAQLVRLLRRLHEETREQYGAIKLWREARARGIQCGRHRVARLRKLAGLEARRVRRFRIIVEHHQLPPPAPNLLQQCFATPRLDRVWVGDVTHVPTRAGWLYVAVLLDLCSRRVVGWHMSAKPDQQLTLTALAMAVRQRRIRPGLIHHSDQGPTYSCLVYQRRLVTLGITPSMSRKGNCYDNAVAESFFSTLKNELVHQQIYHSREEASREIFAFIEGFYNRQRLHQSLGYLSPLAFERQMSDS